jgi:hypothetical protein
MSVSAFGESIVTESFINEHEFRVIALQRSGHHAIIQWLLANIDGGYCFLNHCRPGQNPFLKQFIAANPEKRFVSNIPGISIDEECGGRHVRKQFLIYNYEQCSLDEILDAAVVGNHDAFLGTSRTQTDVIIIRDPFNNLASLLKMVSEFPAGIKRSLKLSSILWRDYLVAVLGVESSRITDKLEERLVRTRDRKSLIYRELRRAAQLWKEYAAEAAGSTKRLNNLLVINYNRWFADESYRASLGAQLNMVSVDKGIDQVAKWGPASSFDKLSFDGRANEMKVLERWKHYANDELYRSVCGDPELHRLSHELFGEIEGVGVLLPEKVF